MAQDGLLRVAPLALIAWAGLAGAVMADDWMVDRLRGEVQVQVAGAWQALQRGDIVSDESRIRSLDGSRVVFTRGAEAIELSGATEIRIFDQVGQRMTTVMQAYGTVTVEAERLQVQHFSIQTPYLAAIVKGTRFTVHSSDGQSSVDVERGLVQVQDYVHGVATDITPGQSAMVSPDVVLDVSGIGAHAPLVTLDGQLVDGDSVVTNDNGSSDGKGRGSEASNAGGNGNGNAYGLENGKSGNGSSHAGGNGNGQANGHGGSNAGGNGNGNAHGLENGNSGSGGNSEGNGNGNAGSNSGNGNAYGHDNDKSGPANNGNGNSGQGNENGKGNAKS
jgi:Fe2+-dicitrate sensor, membrane component